MLQDIASARQRVDLEMYTFASDLTGWKFARALVASDTSGRQARVIYDSMGSRDSLNELFDFMLGHGVEVYEYAPTFPRRWSLLRKKRDHRKILLVDGQVGYVGGINISNEYVPLDAGGHGWRDTALRIVGPAALDLQELFERTWSTGPFAHVAARPLEAPPTYDDGLQVAVMGARRWRDRRSIARHYFHAISSAQRRIWITNAYFVPDRRFLRALRLAAQRGVDVRLIVPAQSDAWPVYYATRALFTRLLSWGVKVFEWQNTMMHAKTAVIDGVWSMVGSFNLDHLSLLQNLEVTVLVLDAGLGKRMEDMFELDLYGCREVRPVEWRSRGLARRFVERGCYACRWLM
jgi:cardiolipin synthase